MKRKLTQPERIRILALALAVVLFIYASVIHTVEVYGIDASAAPPAADPGADESRGVLGVAEIEPGVPTAPPVVHSAFELNRASANGAWVRRNGVLYDRSAATPGKSLSEDCVNCAGF